MDLVISEHIRIRIVGSSSPHKPAAVFSIDCLRIHLLILVRKLIKRGITLLDKLMKEFHRLLVVRICPVVVISAKHIDKLCNLIEYICFFP